MNFDIKTYTRAELQEIFHTDRTDIYRNALKRAGYTFESGGRGQGYWIKITESPKPPSEFEKFARREFSCGPQTKIEAMQKFLFLLFYHEEYRYYPATYQAQFLKEVFQIEVSDQTLRNWKKRLIELNWIAIDTEDMKYYACNRGQRPQGIDGEIHKAAWKQFYKRVSEGEDAGDVACFDRNGYWIEYNSTGDYIALDYNTINLLPGENKILDALYGVPDKCQYVNGAISYIEYMDGSVWESEAIEAWRENSKAGFDIEKWRANIDGMKELADKAISDNPYMSISIQGSTRDNFVRANFNTDVGDIGNRAIISFTILMLCSDSNGFPVNTGHGNLAANSCSYIMEGNSAKSNAHGTGSFEFYISQVADIQSLEGIISEIEFSDGTIWENPYAPYWELYYGDVFGK